MMMHIKERWKREKKLQKNMTFTSSTLPFKKDFTLSAYSCGACPLLSSTVGSAPKKVKIRYVSFFKKILTCSFEGGRRHHHTEMIYFISLECHYKKLRYFLFEN